MDERGRVPMPPRYREALMHGIVLTEGTPDRCLRAYPTGEFEKTAANYMSSPITTNEGRLLRRNFFSAAHDTELDRQGRVLIPAGLRQFAGLTDKVVISGAAEAIEIWDAAAYAAKLAEEEATYRQTLGAGE
jgi:MraZ protein